MSTASHARSRNRRSSSTVFVLAILYAQWFRLTSNTQASMWAEYLLRQTEPSPLQPDQAKSPILARSIVAVCNEQMAMAISRKERRHFLPPPKRGGSPCRFFYGNTNIQPENYPRQGSLPR